MTSIAIYGATGWLGSKITAEAVSRGHHVTAIARHAELGTERNVTTIAGDAGDAIEVAQIAATHDVVVSAIGPSRAPDGDHEAYLATFATLAGHVGNTRLLVVGGAGSLLTADGVRLVDSPGFPEEYKPEALTQGRVLEFLRATDDLDWTYLSPAPEIAPGPRTGEFTLGDDHPAGPSVSDSDYAVALVDEIERPRHRHARFTVAN